MKVANHPNIYFPYPPQGEKVPNRVAKVLSSVGPWGMGKSRNELVEFLGRQSLTQQRLAQEFSLDQLGIAPRK